MNHVFTFHKTVRGYSHVKRNIPCEDSSASYSDDRLGFQIIAVCDGHGESACLRSSFGARSLAEVTVNCLKEYAESIDSVYEFRETNRKDLLVARSQNEMIKRLTDIILSRWYRAIFEDLDQHPLTEEELQNAGRYEAAYRAGERLEHVYGTTLIAALHMDDLLILLQQGDGRCDVFYEDGSVNQPIPWDDRCFENVTTSMCDDDAGTSIRHCVVDLHKKPVIACYMGSDGVEDSYMDMEGTHSFYRSLSCKIAKDGTEGLEEYLEGYLPGFSEEGSGDDVSVAGILDLEAIQCMAERFAAMNEQYSIDSSLSLYRTKLSSMERKHNFLERKLTEAENKIKTNRAAYQQLLERHNKVEERLKTIEGDIEEAQKTIEDSETVQSYVENLGNRVLEELQKRVLGGILNEGEEKIVQLKQRQGEGNGILRELKKKLTGSQQDVDAALAEYDKAKNEYEEYHQKYEAVAAEVRRLEKQKADLTKEVAFQWLGAAAEPSEEPEEQAVEEFVTDPMEESLESSLLEPEEEPVGEPEEPQGESEVVLAMPEEPKGEPEAVLATPEEPQGEPEIEAAPPEDGAETELPADTDEGAESEAEPETDEVQTNRE